MAGKKKKGFGSALKGLIFETVDDEFDEELDALPTDAQHQTQKLKNVAKAEDVINTQKDPVMNKDVVESIKTAMDDANLDGYDYYEFMHSISEQTDMPSEKKKYEVVFSVIKGMGITKDHLITTADHYINVISKHRAEFESKIDLEEQEKVVKLRNDADVIETTITTKSDQIEALKAEIVDLHKKKVSVLGVSSKNDAELTQLKQEGSMAYKLFTSQITDGKSKINQYIS